MKKKIFLSLLVVLSLFLITGCEDKKDNKLDEPNVRYPDQHSNNPTPTPDDNTLEPTTDNPVEENNQNEGNFWYIGKTLTAVDGSWGANYITLVSQNANGIPTTIRVTGSGKSVDGEDLNGSFTIKVSECNDEAVIGKFSKTRVSIKGEFCNGKGKCLLVDIS